VAFEAGARCGRQPPQIASTAVGGRCMPDRPSGGPAAASAEGRRTRASSWRVFRNFSRDRTRHANFLAAARTYDRPAHPFEAGLYTR
jgi:hypothetical protein